MRDLKTETNVIEFGVSRGSSLITISKFVKEKQIFLVDSFGDFAKDINTIYIRYR